MTKPYQQRVDYLQGEVGSAVGLVERLRARARLLRLTRQRSDVGMDTVVLLREAADRLEELGDK